MHVYITKGADWKLGGFGFALPLTGEKHLTTSIDFQLIADGDLLLLLLLSSSLFIIFNFKSIFAKITRRSTSIVHRSWCNPRPNPHHNPHPDLNPERDPYPEVSRVNLTLNALNLTITLPFFTLNVLDLTLTTIPLIRNPNL